MWVRGCHVDRFLSALLPVATLVLAHATSVLAQADPVITLTKDTGIDSVRLAWSVGAAPYQVLRRTTADPALDPGVTLQSGYVLQTFDDVGALSASDAILYYTVTAADAPDTTPPIITITSPLDGSSIATTTPTVTISFAEPLAPLASSGLDLSTLRVPIDDVERVNELNRTDAGATLDITTPLSEGLHTIVASIRDIVGNQATAAASFSVNGPIIASLFVDSGLPGATVHVLGQGFSATPANNTVLFGGEPATVTAASQTDLTVQVPGAALGGPVTVTVNALRSNAKPFTVIAVNGFTRINNIYYRPTGDLIVVDRMADRTYCVPVGSTTPVTADVHSRPVGLGVTSTDTLYIGAFAALPAYQGPIYTLSGWTPSCTTSWALYEYVNRSTTTGGQSFALAHRKGTYSSEDPVYVAYRETQSSMLYAIFRITQGGARQQIPSESFTVPLFTIVTAMEFDDANNLFVTGATLTGGGRIYYIPAGATTSDAVLTITSPLLATTQPAGMTFDDRGNLYVACQGNGTIVRIRPSFGGTPASFDGTIQLVASGYAAGFDGVRALTFRRIAGRPVLAVAEATRVLYLPLNDIEVLEVEFDHGGGTDSSISVWHNATTDVVKPEWSGLAPPRNEPVVVVQNQQLTVKAWLQALGGINNATVRAVASVPGFDLDDKPVAFTSGDRVLVSFPLKDNGGRVPSGKVDALHIEYQWKVRDISPGGSPEVDINSSGKHPVYVTLAPPEFPQWEESPGVYSTEPWVDGVIEKAATYARGAGSETDALAAIATNLYASHQFDYNAFTSKNLFASGVFLLTQLMQGRAIECQTSSAYFVTLARSVGLPTSKTQIRMCGDVDLPKWPTSPVRLTWHNPLTSSCESRMFTFHNSPYDNDAGGVYDPLLKVACTAGGADDGFVPVGMDEATYRVLLDPTSSVPLCRPIGVPGTIR